VLDPPYIHSPGRHQTDHRYNNAATTKGFYYTDILDLYMKGFIEAKRVLKPGGLLWVKCMDQVMSGKQQWGHVDLFKAAEELGYYGRDLFVLIPTSRTSKNSWPTQHHARKTHSYLWVFQNGKQKRTKK
jgi:methylase of polypeptide subunit release factors